MITTQTTPPAHKRVTRAEKAFRAFIGDPHFPCLAAKGVMRNEGFRLRRYGVLGSARSTMRLSDDLAHFVSHFSADTTSLHSFVAVFPCSVPRDEVEFERRLWEQLQALHECDSVGVSWDPMVSDDPSDADFSFSFGGCALFVIGVHPASSRLARRFRWPALVFNPHAQFERLRADGRYAPLKAAVREREIALQGSLNPNLADFGEQSEARQYSGREVPADWQCPFHRMSR